MIYCDKCNGEFDIVVKTKKLDVETEQTYFVCPHCNEVYVAFLLDDNIRKLQKEVKEKQLKMNKTRDISVVFKMQKEIQTAHKVIKKMMDDLKSRWIG